MTQGMGVQGPECLGGGHPACTHPPRSGCGVLATQVTRVAEAWLALSLLETRGRPPEVAGCPHPRALCQRRLASVRVGGAGF